MRSNHLHYPGDERDWKYGPLENKLETNIYYWYNILKFNWIFAELKPRSPRSSSFRVKWNIYQTLFKHSMECKYLRCHDFCLFETYFHRIKQCFREDIDDTRTIAKLQFKKSFNLRVFALIPQFPLYLIILAPIEWQKRIGKKITILIA